MVRFRSVPYFASAHYDVTRDYLIAQRDAGFPVDTWNVVILPDGVEVDRTANQLWLTGEEFLSDLP